MVLAAAVAFAAVGPRCRGALYEAESLGCEILEPFG
jgi:hypothetical protein